MSIQRVIELQQELSKSNDRVKELEAVVSMGIRLKELEAENKELKEYINGVEFNLERSDSINDNLQAENEKLNIQLLDRCKDCKEYKVIEELENKIIDIQQRLDKAVEIIKSYQKCNDIGDGYGCCNLIQAECIDKFLEANPLNTSQVESNVNTHDLEIQARSCDNCSYWINNGEKFGCSKGIKCEWTPKPTNKNNCKTCRYTKICESDKNICSNWKSIESNVSTQD